MGRTRLRLIFLVAAVHVLVTSSQATVWIVDDDGQDSPIADFTTIQPAIDASSNSDSIFVYPGTYTGPGQYVVDLQGKDITLTSIDGASVTFIDGQSQRGGLRCGPGTTSLTQITGFTIQNCQVSADDARGGGIYCDGSPTISGCTISGNKAIGVSAGNARGGGIYCDGSPTISNCSISGNKAIGQAYAMGGGISIGSNATSPLFEYCTISNNEATASLADATSHALGGGIHIDYGVASATFEHCMVSGNLAANLVDEDHISDGGGLYNRGAGVSLLDCTIMTNTASTAPGAIRGAGGGVCSTSPGDTSPGDIILTDCTILSNQSTISGGGLQMRNGDLTLVNCDVSYNATGNDGGGLCWVGSSSVLQITGGSFIGNATTDPDGNGGGGIFCSPGQSSIQNVDISGNQSAGSGGGLLYHMLTIHDVGTHTLSNCTVVGNSGGHGGGISCQGAGPINQVLIQNCQISQNHALSGSGGGINIHWCNPEIAYCDIFDNNASIRGGGLFGYYSSKPTILDTTITGNTADVGGGGIYVDAGIAPDTEFSLTAVVLCGNTPNQACGPWVDGGVCLVQSCDGLNNPAWPTACGCPADFNTDNMVDSTDLQQVITNMGDEGGVSDIAADCGVNIRDLLDVLSQWGPCS
jgi:hypothetical protein